MASRPLKSYAQGGTTVDIPIPEIMRAVSAFADEITEALAKEILKRARANARTQFDSRTGNLIRSGFNKKSRFNPQERIVGFSAPHAHLVEHGHVMLTKDRKPTVKEHVLGYPFLEPAQKSVEADKEAIAQTVTQPYITVGK